MEIRPAARSRRPAVAVAVFCVALQLAAAAVAWTAALGKSSTVDEPMHALSAWMVMHRSDFRINHQDPGLWQYWIALPQGTRLVRAEFPEQDWIKEAERGVLTPYQWTKRELYQTPGNDGEALVRRSRAMGLILSVVLGLLVSWWAWKLGGAAAALSASIVYALCPNFLAHGPMVKNDVAMALAWLAVAVALWQCGKRLTWKTALAVALGVAAGANIKFTGLFLLPIAGLVLGWRALAAGPWEVFGRTVASRAGKFAAVGVLGLFVVLTIYGATWAIYQFRFSPTPDPSVLINMKGLMARESGTDLRRVLHRPPTTQEEKGWEPGLVARAVMFGDRHRLLPQAYLAGILYTHANANIRQNFLLGELALHGWWYYFPVGFAVKTPLATLASTAGALVVLARSWRALRDSPGAAWAAVCLLVPPAVYAAYAMTSHMNIGFRHFLPVPPFIFIGVGLATGRVSRAYGAAGQITLAALAVGLAVETLAAYPNYIAFFNAAAGGPEGGAQFLGDSNLDWGQDLPALARWRRRHPEGTLVVSYFGTVDPAFYGIKCIDLEKQGYPQVEEAVRHATPDNPIYLAVSTTYRQGLNIPVVEGVLYYKLEQQRPIALLNGTISIYRLTPVRDATMP